MSHRIDKSLKTSEEKNAEFSFQQALRIVANLSPDANVPQEAISNLDEAIDLGSVKALRLMVKIILYKQNSLSNSAKFYYLKKGAKIDGEAAYVLARSLIGVGPLSVGYKNTEEALEFYYYAIKQNHPTAFTDMLTAICDNKLTFSAESFVNFCNRLIFETKDKLIALIVGALYCGVAPTQWSALKKLKLDNPDRGFEYLFFVAKYGPDDLGQEAVKVINDGLIDGKFSARIADEFKNPAHEIEKTSRSQHLR